MPANLASLGDIRKQLGRKATFEAAVSELAGIVAQPGGALSSRDGAVDWDAVWDVVHRVFVLLKTRYTSPAFWRAGRCLFAAAKVHACCVPPAQCRGYAAWPTPDLPLQDVFAAPGIVSGSFNPPHACMTKLARITAQPNNHAQVARCASPCRLYR